MTHDHRNDANDHGFATQGRDAETASSATTYRRPWRGLFRRAVVLV
ncbi:MULTISPECIES: hypothetical protein [Mycobacterium]|nr:MULTISPECIES: hypothetical protein [Mycobacterium]MCV7090571.1 hypothetical protein [Mycobacterium interjectum]